MSLKHEFFVVNGDFDFNNKYEWYRTNRYIWKGKAEVSDDDIQYLMDFLNWVPSYNPETKQNGKGLNYYGTTVFNEEGIRKLLSILNKWLGLIEEAPEIFSLKGETVWEEEDDGEGYWKQTRNRKKRRAMQTKLENLIVLAEKASKNNHIIIHFGI